MVFNQSMWVNVWAREKKWILNLRKSNFLFNIFKTKINSNFVHCFSNNASVVLIDYDKN